MFKLKKQEKKKDINSEIEMIDVDPMQVKVTTWIENYSSVLPYAVLILVAVLVITYRFLSVGEGETIADYQRADTAYRQLMATPADSTALEKLYLLTQNHAALKTKYDGILAELFFVHQNDKGIDIGERMLTRTKDLISQDGRSFAETTLAIQKGADKPALEQANELATNLDENDHMKTLKAFNLLRIASIYKRQGETEKAKEAWQNYEQKVDPATKKKIAAHFQLGNASLEEFFLGKQG